MSEQPKIELGIYEHYKGKKYEVIGIAKHSEAEEYFVMYMPLYESESKYWVRPYDMFVESIEKDGQIIPRFAKIK